MSYNYLPLDSKRLRFQQVKNLLEFDQLVSVTFDAHEKILAARYRIAQQLDANAGFYNHSLAHFFQHFPTARPAALTFTGVDLITNAAKGIAGEPAPIAVSKVALMLKIKAIGHGRTAVDIETVKRLMDLYNHGVFPVFYSGGYLALHADTTALAQLSLPLTGQGDVFYHNQILPAAGVLQELNLSPLQLQPLETTGLLTGEAFTLAFALYLAIETEKLLHDANYRQQNIQKQEQAVELALDLQAYQQVEGVLHYALETIMRGVNVPEEFTLNNEPKQPEPDIHGVKEPLLFAYDHVLRALAELGEVIARQVELAFADQAGTIAIARTYVADNKSLIFPYTFYRLNDEHTVPLLFSNTLLTRGVQVLKNVQGLAAMLPPNTNNR